MEPLNNILISNVRSCRSNIFSVNTKSTCFLCLRDIFAETWAVDENGCLINNNGTDNRHLQQITYDLRTILRLAHLSSEHLQKLIGEWDEFKRKGFTVSLCSACGITVKSLDKLFQNMELIRMKIHEKLTEFTEIIKESDKDLERVKLFCGALNSPKLYKTARKTRNHLQIKCKLALKKDPPQVRLTKSFRQSQHKSTQENGSPKRSPVLKPSFSKKKKEKIIGFISCSYCAKVFNSYFNRNRHQRSYCAKGPRLKDKFRAKAAPPKKPDPCKICGATFNYPSNLYRHTKARHPHLITKRRNTVSRVMLEVETSDASEEEVIIKRRGRGRRTRVSEEIQEADVKKMISEQEAVEKEVTTEPPLVPVDLILD